MNEQCALVSVHAKREREGEDQEGQGEERQGEGRKTTLSAGGSTHPQLAYEGRRTAQRDILRDLREPRSEVRHAIKDQTCNSGA